MLLMVVILPLLAYTLPQHRRMLISAWFIYAIACIGCLIVMRRYFPMARIQEKTITSHGLFGTLLCAVDREKPVYYAMVDLRSMEGTSHFIAISNAEFSCGAEKEVLGHCFFKRYDRKQVILLPYDEKTARMLDVRQYINLVNDKTHDIRRSY